MADENKPAFYPRVGRNIAKNFRSAQPPAFIEDPRAMEIPHEYYDIPTKENRELSRRRGERIADLERQKSADTSPLEKLAGGLQAGRFMGSALTQAVNSLPTRLFKGDDAADKFIEERIYKPEQPLAYEYAGDIGNFLEKLETEYKIPPLMPEAVALQYLTGPAASQAKRMAGKGIEQAGMALERKMEPVVRGALERGGLPREMALGMGQGTQSNIIKPAGGGNWLEDSVKQALVPLKRNTAAGNDSAEILRQMKERYTPEVIAGLQEGSRNNVLESIAMLERDVALNNWVDSNLANYVKKQMATEKDPVRRLAEEGISHLPDTTQMSRFIGDVEDNRLKTGFPQGLGQSQQAKIWESLADSTIRPKQLGETIRKNNPGGMTMRELILGEPDGQWAAKAPDTEMIYEMRLPGTSSISQIAPELGFDHIMDVLREDVVSGRIRPDQLNKVSMEQAVRRAHEYDLEMAAKRSSALAEARKDLPVYKDYPEGYKWVQLKNPGDFAAESEAMGHSARGYEPPKGHPDWVEGSGDRGMPSYGLGGWEAIKSGKAKVYSLVDKKGEPHVTIEVGESGVPSWAEIKAQGGDPLAMNKEAKRRMGITDENERDVVKNANGDKRYELNRQLEKHFLDIYREQFGDLPSQIHQIKGKGNARPVEKYDPFTQQFVLGNNWTDVYDLENTGLKTIDQAFPRYEDAKFFANAYPNKKYVTQADIDAHNLQVNQDLINEYANHRLMPDPESKATFGRTEPMTVRELAELSFPGDIEKQANMIRGALQGQGGILPPLEGLKRGGVVVSKNPDTMMLELAGGGLVKGLVKAVKSAKNESQIANKINSGPAFGAYGYTDDALRRERGSFISNYGVDYGQALTPSFEFVPVSKLKATEKISDAQVRSLMNAMKESGNTLDNKIPPVVVDSNGNVLDGHHRLEATRRLGYAEVPVIEKFDRQVGPKFGEEYASGGLVKGLKAAAKAAKAEPELMKASEALGKIEGRPLVITQADRTKVGGGFLGGPGFSSLQLTEPEYRAAEAAWGVKTPGVAKMILGGAKKAGENPVFTTMIGSPTQHQSNQMVFDKLYGDFKKSAKKGNLDPELRDKINLRLASAVDKEGNPVFPPDVDILDKNFKDIANTFDRRSIAGHLMGGVQVGGKKGQIIDYDKIIRETTDPALLDVPSGALGNRLFTLSGGIIDRPDLHPAFPTILQGEDLGVNFSPVARDILMRDFIQKTKQEKGRKPGYMDFTRGHPPSQLITEDILTEMQKLGLKKGGTVKKAEGGAITGDDLIIEERPL